MKPGRLLIRIIEPQHFPFSRLSKRYGRGFDQTFRGPFPRQQMLKLVRHGLRIILQCVLQFQNALINRFVRQTVWELEEEIIGGYVAKSRRLELGVSKRLNASSHLRCFGRMTNFPIASASADVVQRTSLVDMFKKICLFARETQLVDRATATHLLFGYISNLNVVLNSEKASGEATSTPLIYERL
jgi:hypothetical protein